MCPPIGDKEGLALSMDVGTSSTRVMFWDVRGQEVQGVRAQRTYSMRTTPDGGVEIEGEELAQHVEGCLDEALAALGDRAKHVHVVGVSTFWHSFLGLDAHGQPITPLYNWADRRAAKAAQRLRRQLNAEEVWRRTGCPLHPSYYPARLAWLQETNPTNTARVVRWVSPGEYLYSRWFGRADVPLSVSMASATGIFNQQTCKWDVELLKALGVSSERFAPIDTSGKPLQGLASSYAQRWPALAQVPFFLPYGDGACSNVGSGCVDSAHVAINVGTSGALRVLWDTRKEPVSFSMPSGFWHYRGDSYRPLVGAAFSDGGLVYAWMHRTLQLTPYVEAALTCKKPGEHGLLFLPFLAGERSFGWNPEAHAALTGLQIDTTPADILAAAMEAVALQFALAVERLQSSLPLAKQIVASGGALAHAPVWAQMLADAIGQPIALAAEAEASSRGAALFALEGVGLLKSLDEAPCRLLKTLEPKPENFHAFQELRARFLKLYETLLVQP